MKICEAGRDSCGCKEFTKGIRTINNQYPDDNRDFDINAGPGILITPATGGITISNTGDTQSFIEGTNIKFTPNGDDLEIGTTDDMAIVNDLSVGGDTTLNGDLNVNGNIYNQGASYESHMEQVYTEDDYIIMRDNAVTGLGSGDFSGFQVKLYDGVNDGRLVIDNSGTARVGDVGDEQPLLTRDESANLTNGQLFKWDAVNLKAVGQSIDATPTDGSNAPVSSDGVYDALAGKQSTLSITTTTPLTGYTVCRYGQIVTLSINGVTYAAGESTIDVTIPTAVSYFNAELVYVDNSRAGAAFILSWETNKLHVKIGTSAQVWGNITYLTNDP